MIVLATFLMDLARHRADAHRRRRRPVLGDPDVRADVQRLSLPPLLTQLAMAKTLPKGDDKSLGGGHRWQGPRDRSRRKSEMTEREVEDIEERSSPRTPVIYEIVRRLGEEEMARPIGSLWWSGVAAGLSISFSLLAQAILHTHLPDEPGGRWSPILAIRSASSWWCCRASSCSPRPR